MREAVAMLRNIVAKKDIVISLIHYVVLDGMLYASDGNIVAATPAPTSQEFAVRAVDFHRFLERVSGEVNLDVQKNFHLKVSCGRFRATLPGIDPKTAPFTKRQPEGDKIKVSDKFITSIKAARPFISDNATQKFALCAAFQGSKIFATNNVVVVEGKNTGLPESTDFLLAFDTIDFILSKPTGITHLTISDSQVGIFWSDGSWIAAPQFAFKFPQISPVFYDCPMADLLITENWREAYSHIAEFTDGEIHLFKDKIICKSESGALHEAEIENGFVLEGREFTTWNSKFFDTVIQEATHLTLYNSRGPRASFRTPQLIGLVAGMGK